MGKETTVTDKKCIDCQEAGNNEKGKFICYNIRTIFWFKEVLDKNFDCECFKHLIDIGERIEVTYPIKELEEL